MKYLLFIFLTLSSAAVLSEDDDFFLKERNDPTVENAFAAAKANIDVFLDALKARGSDGSKYNYYGAYLKFTEGDTVEFLWLADVQEYKDFYIGVIISEPQLLTDTKYGKTIGFHSSDIYDWQLNEKESGRVLGTFLACATSSEDYLNENGFICSK
ncbi:DUF2314 domain-containing protein [Paraglaciecola marina]|uniref:DUF2314 domain-containing protein n=1 Tax=Paraglaciecola marina TaxID=2500157 RepID=UPI0014151845|nr:DUF2314 domain-containing protein [Paraglaciecola marina]